VGVKKARTDYEARFAYALRRIVAYMTTRQLRRQSEKKYGLSYEESLEMAYENLIEEARAALRGYRPKRQNSLSTKGACMNDEGQGAVEKEQEPITEAAPAEPPATDESEQADGAKTDE
jgi:hypothetical protein